MYFKQHNTMIKTIHKTHPGVIINVYVNMMNIHLISALLIIITGIHNFFGFLFDFLIGWKNFCHNKHLRSLIHTGIELRS